MGYQVVAWLMNNEVNIKYNDHDTDNIHHKTTRTRGSLIDQDSTS